MSYIPRLKIKGFCSCSPTEEARRLERRECRFKSCQEYQTRLAQSVEAPDSNPGG